MTFTLILIMIIFLLVIVIAMQATRRQEAIIEYSQWKHLSDELGKVREHNRLLIENLNAAHMQIERMKELAHKDYWRRQC